MGFTGGGVKYRCEIGSAPAPSPWQPACRSPPQPPVPGSKQAKRCPPPSPLLPVRPFTAPSRPSSHTGAPPAAPRPSPSGSRPWQEQRSRPALGGPGTAAPESQGSALVAHPAGPRRSSSNCSRPPSPPPAAKDTAAPPGSRRRAPLPPRGGSRPSHPEPPPRPPGRVSANCPAGRPPDPSSTDRAEPLVPASHRSTTQPRRRPPIFPPAGPGEHAAGRRERTGTALPVAGGEAASRSRAPFSSAQLRSAPLLPRRRLPAGGRLAGPGRAGRG